VSITAVATEIEALADATGGWGIALAPPLRQDDARA